MGTIQQYRLCKELECSMNELSTGAKTCSCYQRVNSVRDILGETTKLMNAWAEDSPLQKVAFKAIMVMPSLLLKKPSKNSKSKDHTTALERRLLL